MEPTKCQSCGKTGGPVAQYRDGSTLWSQWECPHCPTKGVPQGSVSLLEIEHPEYHMRYHYRLDRVSRMSRVHNQFREDINWPIGELAQARKLLFNRPVQSVDRRTFAEWDREVSDYLRGDDDA